jgi:hypothetical protein
LIKHIVFWRLKHAAHANDKATNARLIKEQLETPRGRIPGLLSIEVGFDFIHAETSSDVALYSVMEERAALDAYQVHPLHKAVAVSSRKPAPSDAPWTTKFGDRANRRSDLPRDRAARRFLARVFSYPLG